MKQCVLEPKECTNCGRCDDRCELDPSKVCDNCFRCLETEEEYLEIPISGVYMEEDYLPDGFDGQGMRNARVQTLPGMCGERPLRR